MSLDNNHLPDADLGKSSFLYYLLLRRLSDKKPTAFQVSDHFVLFQDRVDRVHVYSGKDTEVTIPEGSLALTGADDKAAIPCDAFFNAVKDGNARIIQATDESRHSLKEWRREHQASVYYYVMDHFSLDEIKALGLVRLVDRARTSFLPSMFQQTYTWS
jgi:hypothetical protein